MTMYQLGWFSTGRNTAAKGLLKTMSSSIKQSEIKADRDFVFCTREPSEAKESDLFMNLGVEYQISLICLPYQKLKASKGTSSNGQVGALSPWRLDYNIEVMNRLQDFHPGLCVLAGYMLIVRRALIKETIS